MGLSSSVAASPSDRGRFRRLTEDRLRASLRLLLPAAVAGRLTQDVMRRADDDPYDALRSLSAAVSREFLAARIRARLPARRVSPSRGLPLGFDRDLSPRAALVLALHLGLDLDGETLADVCETTPEEIGDDLDRARRAGAAVDGEPVSVPPSCARYASVRGRYRDSSLEADDRVLLLTHLQSCDACRVLVEQAEATDSCLLSLVSAWEAAPPAAATPRVGVSGPLLIASSVGVGIVALLVMIVVGNLLERGHEPAPLLASQPDGFTPDPAPDLSGWLLQRSQEGYLEALNLATGETRGLDSTDFSPSPPVYLVGDRYIATWRPSDGRREDTLSISPIGGQVMRQMSWDRVSTYWYPSGWLDATTLLIARSPGGLRDDSVDEFFARLARESRLVAVNVETGEEWDVMTGNVAAAYPSPDGSMVAVVSPYDRRWPGNTIELRPIVNGIAGDPVVTIEHRLRADGVWSGDSQRFFAAMVADETVSLRVDGDGTYEQVDLVAIERGGETRTLSSARAPAAIRAMAASPEGRALVYLVEDDPATSGSTSTWRSVRMDLLSGELLVLAEGTGRPLVYPPAWSPDGTHMVMPVARTFPLEDDDDVRSLDLVATALMAFDQRATQAEPWRVLYGAGRQLYRWMPEQVLATTPPEPVAEIDGEFSSPELVGQIPASQRLTSDSTVTSDGRYVVLDDTVNSSPVIVKVVAQSKRLLSYHARDISWFNSNQMAIGVAPTQFQGETTRLVLYAPDISITSAYLDYRRYDPANLGDDTNRSYALPLVSRDGSRVSFFVVDRQSGGAELWLDTGFGPADVVHSWTVPPDALVNPPIVALWADSRTLLIGQPDEWEDGLPRVVTLARVRVSDDGEVEVERLVEFDARGSERGLLLTELEISPDGASVAYRLRHYSERSSSSGRRDSLHIASTGDLSRAVEIARGTPGEGLTWAPDSRWLFAGIRDRIAALSADGRDLVYLTPEDADAAWPLWTSANELWFALESPDTESRVWRVRPE